MARAVFALLLCWLAILAAAQERPATLEVPDKFNLDMKTAARLRPDLLAQSTVAAGRYALGSRTFQKLVEQVDVSRNVNRSWELRIIGDGLLNAFSSPDGTIYVESGLADLAGQSAGLWAAILSHEIAHVVRRDWARRYLYEESLRSGSGGLIVLGDPGLPSAAWADSHKASEDLARFCRQLELDADLKSLVLMARADITPTLCPRSITCCTLKVPARQCLPSLPCTPAGKNGIASWIVPTSSPASSSSADGPNGMLRPEEILRFWSSPTSPV